MKTPPQKMIQKHHLFFCLLTILFIFTNKAQAELTIEITKGNAQAVPIAVVPFASDTQTLLPDDVASIVSDDLALSGQFAPVSQQDFLGFPTEAKSVYYPDWKKLDVKYLVLGHIIRLVSEKIRIEYTLLDIDRQKVILDGYVEGKAGQLRPLGHGISDQIYHKITGTRGIFSTKLLYVLVKNKGTPAASYHLVYADMDGHRPVTIVNSSQPVVAPAWSPDHQKVAYVTYTKDLKQIIYVQDLASGKRQIVCSGYALSTSPAFSPDGKSLAMTLSKGRDAHIYLKNISTGELRQLTKEKYVLDSEPTWTPDGKSIVFTSNRGGSAQLYQINLDSRKVERLTFSGRFNARARVLPDGKRLAFVTKGVGDQAYHIAILNLKSGDVRVLSTEPFEDSPSVSPNGKMLVFSSLKGKHYVLGMVTVDGKVSYQLPAREGDVQEPAWSPFM